jgi:putative colanic acid biosysnthesis UDP-glucose lipid carrier transferase
MLFRRQVLYWSRMVADIILLSIVFWYSIWVDNNFRPFNILTIDTFFLLILMIIWVLSAHIIELYDEFRLKNFSFELIILIKNILVQSFSSIIIIFLINEVHFSRMFVVRYSFMLLILVGTEKYLIRTLLVNFRKKGMNLRNILIVGAGEVGQRFFETINDNPNFGYNTYGFLDDEKKDFLNSKYLGPINNLERIFAQVHVDDVIITLPNHAEDKIHQVISICENHAVRVRIIPDFFKFFSQKYNVSMFGRFPIISVRAEKLNEFQWRLMKRTFDTVFTLILFILVFSWFWPLLALIIKLDSKGPVFFHQKRWGRNNKEFHVYKFRSMNTDSISVDKEGKYQQASKNDIRFTKIGRILRKTNIDELPQFINVLKGEMSLVGPRPHPIPLNLESKDNIKHYMLRHMDKPGITGWAQINGYRGETKDPYLMQKRIEHDLWYIENWSFGLDIQIIFITIWNMLRGDRNAY